MTRSLTLLKGVIIQVSKPRLDYSIRLTRRPF